MKKIKRAIISVSDKSGLKEFSQTLSSNGVEIYSTGGTLKFLLDNGIEAKSIEGYTGFPEMLDGRVKTLHPKIHGGILARRDNAGHMQNLEDHGIFEFDLVCINLYPFEAVISKPDFSFEDAIENIDIGGPSMIRAAAKNYQHVAVLVDPSQYPEFITQLEKEKDGLSSEFLFELAVYAFNRTGSYDAIISNYLNGLRGDYFPQTLNLTLNKQQSLRYGENPHQKAAFYTTALNRNIPWECLHGKELSYNNMLDLDSALRVIMEFDSPMCAIFKHTNPCGLAAGQSQVENLNAALKADPVSFFGGIVAFNEIVQKETAEILGKEFIEIIVAPDFEKQAFDILSAKKNIRLVKIPDLKSIKYPALEIKSSSFGFLLQETDRNIIAPKNISVVTRVKPEVGDIEELMFAFEVVKSIKSNAVVFTRNKKTLGIGAGQMSRIDSMEIAISKAAKFNHDLKGSYLASDAFFPFSDTVERAVQAGVKGIIQPGGSMRDEDSIKAADDAGIFMVFTGLRHFRH
ncbi:MAG: bifunctional phosphoribosylaminoimidazolecarboxamide formyltransferase/IMP cyclohydrolase [Spirochaetia bacterium]|nr:bifunctional phosphoribosylaminoimidazolecarboxamide formyltransferase/IMP cyclohydrolase [Spirochaetia bacterium]